VLVSVSLTVHPIKMDARLVMPKIRPDPSRLSGQNIVPARPKTRPEWAAAGNQPLTFIS